jgi:hypothetical protein
MSENLHIRKLTVADNSRLTGFLGKLVQTADGEWLQRIVAAPSASVKAVEQPVDEAAENAKYYQLFSAIVTWLLEMHQGAIRDWFAELLGKTTEEYMALPFDTDAVVLEQIAAAPEFRSFFSKACAVFNLKSRFGGIIGKLKKNFAMLID